MAKVLVTGATGFIGTNLVSRLRAERHEVLTANSRSGDIATNSTWSAFATAEIVIHLAGRTFVPDSWADPNIFLQTNLYGTVCALDYCRDRHARFIFVSSYLYGVPENVPIPESASLHANNPYALSKKLAEEACRFYADYYGVSITILRPFNIYGPTQNSKFLIPSVVEQVLAGAELRVKDLGPKRDYLYIDDLVDAFLKAIEKPQRFDVFNIASGTSHSVGEVINLIQRIAKTNLPVHSAGERRRQEVMDTRADISRAREILGWHPRWSLHAGCARILQDKNSLI
jgi:GDP-4-dehydro-6-deoxy-D-mannose reductase